MTRAALHSWMRWPPIVLALAALALVSFALATGWQVELPDEGAAAHSFQLLIVLSIASMGLFAVTMPADRTRRDWSMLGFQAAALAAAFAPVAWFGL